MVDDVVAGGAATISPVEDAVAVVRVRVDEELGDTGSGKVEVREGLVVEDVETCGRILGGHDGRAGGGAVHITREATKIFLLGSDL